MYSSNFRKSLKKYKYNKEVISRLANCVAMMSEWKALPISYRNHRLKGNYKWLSEFHLFPDVLVLYEKGKEFITFTGIGSHSDLFG